MLAVLSVTTAQQDEQKWLSCFSVSEEVFSDEKASFLSSVAQKGYVPIPTSCSNHGQTPGMSRCSGDYADVSHMFSASMPSKPQPENLVSVLFLRGHILNVL